MINSGYLPGYLPSLLSPLHPLLMFPLRQWKKKPSWHGFRFEFFTISANILRFLSTKPNSKEQIISLPAHLSYKSSLNGR